MAGLQTTLPQPRSPRQIQSQRPIQHHRQLHRQAQQAIHLHKKKDNTHIHPNFRRNEFFSQCRDFEGEGHWIDSALIEAVIFLRELYGQPIRITSTYRHTECNARVGGGRLSQHTQYSALDFQFVGAGWKTVHRTFQQDIKEKGCVFLTLMDIGIRGYGGYNTFNHLDTRTTPGLQRHRNTPCAQWGTFNPHAFNAEEDPDLLLNHQ